MKTNKIIDQSRHKQTRRRLVLGSLGGVAIWQTPVINRVILPVHAQTSTMTSSFFAANVMAAPSASVSPLDILIAPAYAGVIVASSDYTVEAFQQMPQGSTYDIGLLERLMEDGFEQAEVVYRGSITVGTPGTLTVAENPCNLKLPSLSVEINEPPVDELVLSITSRGQTLIIPAGDGMLPMAMCVETPLPDNFFTPGSPSTGSVETMNSESEKSILDYFVSSAYAGITPEGSNFGLSATKLTETTYAVEHLNVNGDVLRAGTLNIDGSVGSLVFVSDACSETKISVKPTPTAIPASIVAIDQNEIQVQIQQSGGGGSAFITITAPVGSGVLMPVCSPR